MSLELAEACLRAGELDAALQALDEHLAQHAEDANARRLRADVLLRLPGRARDALTDLEFLDSDADPLLRYQALAVLGESDGAFASIEQAWQQKRDPQLAELLLRLLRDRADFDAALKLLTELPKTWLWLGWSGDLYVLRGDYRIAAEYFSAALDDLEPAPKNAITQTQRANLLLRRADAYRRFKRWAEAEADYRAAAMIIPNDQTIPFNQGLTIYESGELRRALPLCRDALDHAPDALCEHMRAILTTEPRYKTLAQALLL